MLEPIEAVAGVAAFFDAHQIPWLIGGSLASSIHGDFRATQDVDVLARVASRHADAMEAALASAYYISADAIRDAVTIAGSFNLVHLGTYMKVDVFVADDSAMTAQQFVRLERVPIETDSGPMTLPFASAEDTVLQNLRGFWLGGEQSTHQLTDVHNVLRVRRARIDNAYLDTWAAHLRITDLLERVRATLPQP